MPFQITKHSLGTHSQEAIGKDEVMIDSAADLSALPQDLKPGSVAYTADLTSMYMKALNGSWVRIGGEA